MNSEKKEIKINRIEELPQFARVFIEDVVNVKGQSINTAVGYCADLRGYFKYLNTEKHITEIDLNCMRNLTLMDLNEYLSYMAQDGKAKRTRNRIVATFKNFFGYLRENKIIEEDISKDLKFSKLTRNDKTVEYLKNDEIKKVFDFFQEERKGIIQLSDKKLYDSIRNECIFQIFLDCCFRISELTNIKIDDIDFEEMSIKVLGKGDANREVFFSRSTQKILKKWLITRINADNDYLFISSVGKQISSQAIRKMIREKSKAMGLKLHPHELRHTGATLKHKSGVDIGTLSELLGHTSLLTTQIYVHVDKEQLKKAARVTPDFRKGLK